MRTPGHDAELAVGFLVTEGLLHDRADLDGAAPELAIEASLPNVVTVALRRDLDLARLQRNFYAASSCGICGKTSLDHLDAGADLLGAGPVVGASVLLGLAAKLRAAQSIFAATGGLHATGAFDARGELLLAREDIGRHNAMDKVIGRLALDGRLPLSDTALLASGRLSFELVQKAAMAGGPILCGISAPSSLAVAAAERLGLTLIGFLRGDGFNVYSGQERIDLRG
jgi:FdhD protein